MDSFFQLLRPFIRGVVRHAVPVVFFAGLLSAGSLFLASRLSIDTDLANLIPDEYASVQALERLRETVGAESEAALAITSPSFEANRAFAEDFIPEALELAQSATGEPYFRTVEYRKNVTFLEENALYFATSAELDMLQDFLDAKLEEATLEANPFYFEIDDEDDLSAETDSLGEELGAIYRDIVSKEYPISDDSTTLVLRLYPGGSQTDISYIENAYEALDSLAAALGPASYHPAMEITSAGRLLRQLIEVSTVRNDVMASFGSGVAAVMLLVLLYFFYKAYRARVGAGFDRRALLALLLRIPVLAVVIGLPLLMSLSWTFGTAYLAYGALNLMTSTLGLVLFGLGIDYGIHFFARYTEERAGGKDVSDAVETTFASTGQAITVGALTTAAALYVLMIADFRGFSQFGFIAGTGIIFALAAMLIVMPAIIVIFERTRLLKLEASASHVAPVRVDRPLRVSRVVLAASLLAVAASIVLLPRISFQYQMGELEPDYEEYDVRRAVVRRVFEDRRNRNPAYFVVDSAEEARAIVERLETIKTSDTLSPTIQRFESLQERFPITDEARDERLARLDEIRNQLSDPFLEADTTADVERLRRAASTTDAIAFEQVPEFLREQFTTKAGELGHFVMVYPSVGLSDGRNSIAFSEDVGTIETDDGRIFHAGSTSLVAADMLKLMRREAPWMVLATFVIVCALMYANFRSLRWMMLALLPLVVGVLWMLLLMEIFGLMLNFYNLIVLPAVLGIGNDAGVHLVHRYREEGRGTMRRIVRSTGEHVTMGSVTTMVGFGGLLLSFHPGLNTIGELAVAGIGATLIAALFFLPALIQWLENRGGVEALDIE